MRIRDERREAAIEIMADHLLKHGLAGASLRALAAAVGTSDRMLLYYFTDKDELISATLARIAARLAELLDAALPPETRLPHRQLLPTLWDSVSSAALRPYMRVWVELAAGSLNGDAPRQAIAGQIAGGFAAWVASRLDIDLETDRARSAALLLATIDGMLLLDAVGRRDLADTAIEEAVKNSAR